jgi:hypothetical protein
VDSNHLPPRYQHGALPVELAAQVSARIARTETGEPELYHGTNPRSEAASRTGGRSPNEPHPQPSGHVAGDVSRIENLAPDIGTGRSFASSTAWLILCV